MFKKILCILLIGFPLHLTAEEYSGTITRAGINSPFEEVAYLDKSVSINFDVQLYWKLSILMGEAVEYSDMKWKINSITVRNIGGIGEDIYYNCKNSVLTCIPDSILKDINIIDIDFILSKTVWKNHYKGNEVAFTVNPGANSRPAIDSLTEAKKSFNSPGSPQWDKLFLIHPNDGRAWQKIDINHLRYKSEDVAKTIFIHPIKVNQLDIIRFQGGYSALFRFFAETEIKKSLNKIQANTKQLKTNKIEKIKAENQDDIFADFEAEEATKELESQSKQISQQVAVENTEVMDSIKKLEQHENQLLLQVKQRVNRKSLPTDDYLPSTNSEGKWGYKDTQGNWIIEAKFDHADNFFDGQARVTFDTYKKYKARKAGHCPAWSQFWKSALINRHGILISTPEAKQKQGSDFCIILDE